MTNLHWSCNCITVAKIVCLCLLFSPLYGLWWFNINDDIGGHYFVLQAWIKYIFIESTPVVCVYISICILAFTGFVITTFIRPAIVRVPLMMVMLIGWAFELTILDLYGGVSHQNLLWILWQERAIAAEMVSGYAPYIARDCAIVVILGVVLCASPSRRFSVTGMYGLLPIVSGALVAGVIVYTKGGTQVFPIPFGTFSNTGIVLAKASNKPSHSIRFWDPAPHDVVTSEGAKVQGTLHPVFEKIVIIMDESVRGDYLSLNDPSQKTTPFLKATEHLVNFGVAISAGNCSNLSRTILRFGMQQSDLPNGWQQGLNKPTIWQFADRAGYKTVHIDAHGRPLLQLISGLSLVEEALIDSKITIIENPGYLRDQKVVDKLLHALKDKGPAFIFVDKYGVHFPYSNKYPPNSHGLPVRLELDAANHENTLKAFLKGLLPHKGTLKNSARAVALYPNAIMWSVDEFFRKLLPGVDLSKTLIIYTSDHGQSLLPGRNTHCSTTPTAPLGEAYVPLFAITSAPEFEQRLVKEAARGFGQFSHFEVFPTLLLAMGYDADWVKRSYGPSLTEAPSPDRKFMIGSPYFQPMMIPADRDSRSASSSVVGRGEKNYPLVDY